MKYQFSFKEVNYGSVEIESKSAPSKEDVINAIMNGNAYYNETEYEDIRLCSSEKSKSDVERDVVR